MEKKPTKVCDKHKVNYLASYTDCPYCKYEEEKAAAPPPTENEKKARTTSRAMTQRGSRMA